MARIKQSGKKAMGLLHKKILEALGQCGFLSIPHFNSMGWCSERHLRNKLKELQTEWGRAMIGYVKYGKEGGGSKPYYYYLTAY